MPEPLGTMRFGVFEVDLDSGRLRKHGLRVRLQDQPFRILALLLSRPGEVVSRAEIQQELWPGNTHVEFEQSLNAAVKRLRAALGDNADAPRYVETIPKQGYRFIAPVHRTNEQSLAQTQSVEVKPTVHAATLDTGSRVLGSAGWRWAAATIVVLLVGMAVWLIPRPSAQPAKGDAARIYRVDTEEPPINPSVSPDGQYIAYFVAEESEIQRSLHLRNLGESRSRRVGVFSVPFPHRPAWSPDSRHVVVFLAPRTLFRVPISGGEPTPIVRLPDNFNLPASPAWNPSLRIFWGGWEVNEVSGELEPAILSSEGGGPPPCSDASRIPKRDLMLCGSMNAPGPIALLDRQGNVLRQFDLGSQPLFSATGHILYIAEGSLWAQKVRGDTLEPDGAPALIARDATDPSLSDDGSLLYLESAGLRQQLVWKDREGREIEQVGPVQWRITQPDFEPESGMILTRARSETRDNWSIWLHDPMRGLSVREVTISDRVERPHWVPGSPEFTYSAGGEPRLQRIQSPESQATALIERGDGVGWVRDWCPDQQCLVFTRIAKGSANLWIMANPKEESRSSKPYLASQWDETSPVISPDGKFIAYQARRPERFGIYVNTFPVPTREIPISTNGTQPAWRADGKELFYVEDARFLMGLPVDTSPTFSVAGPPIRLFEHRELGESRGREYDVSTDGRRFLVVKTLQEPTNVIRLIQNWTRLIEP